MSDTRPKLLIVEDDPGLQRQLRWAYEDYQLFIAGDRLEAIEMLRMEAPDVVTLDLGLPPDPDGTSEGFATLEEILRIKPDTKVIVASGHGARESALNAISGGAYDFYQKPVDIDELGLIVRRAFHVHALEQENARLAEAARTGKAKVEELAGGTLTVTSLGPLGGIATTPVINRPEVAIIGPNKIVERPVFDGDDIRRAKLMNLSISCDHRVVDGWDAASYVQALKKLIETPVLLFAD